MVNCDVHNQMSFETFSDMHAQYTVSSDILGDTECTPVDGAISSWVQRRGSGHCHAPNCE